MGENAEKKIVVLGAGITGLACAWKLSECGFSVTVLEKNGQVGGLSASFKHGEATLDLGPHRIYTQIGGVLDEIKSLLGSDLLEMPKKSKFRFQGNYFNYPLRLPEFISKASPAESASCAADFLKAKAEGKKNPKTYEEYVVQSFGRKTYELIFKDYAAKVWGEPSTLDAELARTRIAIPNLLEMLKRNLFGDLGKNEISAKTVYYPRLGIQELSDAMKKRIEENGGKVLTRAMPTAITCNGRKVSKITYKLNGKTGTKRADFLISTIPLREFIALFANAPKSAMGAAAKLKYRALILLYLAVKKDRLFEENFLFFPEKEFIFNRLSEQKAFSESLVPKGQTVLCAEITCNPSDPLYSASDKEIYEKAIAPIEKAGFFKKGDVLEYFTKREPYAYPVYETGFKENLSKATAFIDKFENARSIGRQGAFTYNNIDHCMDMAFKASEHVARGAGLEEWARQRQKFNYVIID